MGSAIGESSLVLSVEQLVVLGGFLGEPVPGYVTSALEELTRARREATLTMARQSLVERGILIPGEPFRIPVTAARLLEIACRPAISVMIHRGKGPHWSSRTVRIAGVPDASVELLSDGDAFRLTPLHTERLPERIAMRCRLAATPAPAGAGVTLPLNVLREAAATGVPDAAIALLKDGGAPEATAESAGAALAAGERFAVSIVMRAGAGQRTGFEIAWAVAPDGYWLLPPAATPMGGGGGNGNGDDADDLTAKLVPAGGDDVLDALTKSLHIDS
ncbi:ESX secretion-associated protein EspG [Allorhizocola rhizosphaerae]|uniref:ESX secretion-associated protein EspG n=1 Tax=Allorhizocola rhizosphaerae TaxID=1872709 RepID=UPI000E3C3B47|nr:ESX secretion-associated protein EspG [Allorhizocola rhizosphaerae]